MKAPLFKFLSYKYDLEDWEFKKRGLLKRVNEGKFTRPVPKTHESDRRDNNKRYLHYLNELLNPEITEFCEEVDMMFRMVDCWTVRYNRGDYQHAHNHGSIGFSGILYLEFDPSVHQSTCFISPWQEPRYDGTSIRFVEDVKEGSLFIFPSYCLHYNVANESNKTRTVLSFNLDPILPAQQAINKDE